jgi:hypothetical protein
MPGQAPGMTASMYKVQFLTLSLYDLASYLEPTRPIVCQKLQLARILPSAITTLHESPKKSGFSRGLVAETRSK